ncbi:hypothetical protein Hdeb2414_s0006g00222311 [Helianthus debilis subsp. tardiflorus]
MKMNMNLIIRVDCVVCLQDRNTYSMELFFFIQPSLVSLLNLTDISFKDGVYHPGMVCVSSFKLQHYRFSMPVSKILGLANNDKFRRRWMFTLHN